MGLFNVMIFFMRLRGRRDDKMLNIANYINN